MHGIDWRSAVAAAVLSLVVTAFAGLAPALAAGRANAMEALKAATPRTTGRRGVWRGALVAGQLAASLVLLALGGLFVRSLRAAQNIDVGFDIRRVGHAWVSLDAQRMPVGEADALRETMVERALQVSGVAGAAAVASAPLGGALIVPARVPGRDVPTGAPPGKAFAMAVTAISRQSGRRSCAAEPSGSATARARRGRSW